MAEGFEAGGRAFGAEDLGGEAADVVEGVLVPVGPDDGLQGVDGMGSGVDHARGGGRDAGEVFGGVGEVVRVGRADAADELEGFLADLEEAAEHAVAGVDGHVEGVGGVVPEA